MKKLLSKTGLTKKELIVIGFLFISFALGLIIKYSGWKTPEDFSYTESDKSFDQRMKTAFSELESTNLTPQQQSAAGEMKKAADSLLSLKDTGKSEKQLIPGRKININSAYTADLQLLPGIGEVTAERIIEYREQKGGFKRIDDIKKVKGIGDKKFEQIKQYIIVE